MEHLPRNITELLQQIRCVENEHNQLVDEYFQMKDNVKKALTDLNNEPSSNHLNIYNHYSNLSESIMNNIRLKRLSLTNLINELHKHGIHLDNEDESEDEYETSLDEGIDNENSLSLLDLSSKLSSHNNSENNNNNNQEDELF